MLRDLVGHAYGRIQRNGAVRSGQRVLVIDFAVGSLVIVVQRPVPAGPSCFDVEWLALGRDRRLWRWRGLGGRGRRRGGLLRGRYGWRWWHVLRRRGGLMTPREQEQDSRNENEERRAATRKRSRDHVLRGHGFNSLPRAKPKGAAQPFLYSGSAGLYSLRKESWCDAIWVVRRFSACYETRTRDVVVEQMTRNRSAKGTEQSQPGTEPKAECRVSGKLHASPAGTA